MGASREIRPCRVLSGPLGAVPAESPGAVDEVKRRLLEAFFSQRLRLRAETVPVIMISVRAQTAQSDAGSGSDLRGWRRRRRGEVQAHEYPPP